MLSSSPNTIGPIRIGFEEEKEAGPTAGGSAVTGPGSDRLDPSGSLPGLVSDVIGSVALSHVRLPLMESSTHT